MEKDIKNEEMNEEIVQEKQERFSTTFILTMERVRFPVQMLKNTMKLLGLTRQRESPRKQE